MLRLGFLALLTLPSFVAACGSSQGASTGPGDGGPACDTGSDVVGGDAAGNGGDGASEAATDGGIDGATPTDGGGIGAPCSDASDCAIYCLNEPPFNGGYCSQQIVECPAPGSTNNPCPSGSSCANGLVLNDGGAVGDFCLLDCTTSGDCRTNEAYKCCPSLTHDGKSVCAPAVYCP